MKKKIAKLNMFQKTYDLMINNETFIKTLAACGVLSIVMGVGFFLGFIVMGLLHHTRMV